MSWQPWFHRWFGEEYLQLYPHRDREEARDAVQLLLRQLASHGERPGDMPAGASPVVLDLACGAGRHLAALAGHGVAAIGLDLSAHLLVEARKGLPDTSLLQGDMRRLPFADGTFRVVTSFFTSFGYFESDHEDRTVVREIRRVLRPGGFLLLDFLNASRVRTELTPRDVSTMGGREVVQERRLVDDGRRVEKQIRIQESDGGEHEAFTERVRLYDADELVTLLTAEGVEPLEIMGDYTGAPHGPESPRAILFARVQ